MTEADVQTLICERAPFIGIRLWRNNSGALRDKTGRLVRFGLSNDNKQLNEICKSSDLIGIRERDGKFVAIETKEPEWVFRPSDKRAVAQKVFHDIVRAAGGIAGFASSVEQFEELVK